MIEGPVEAVAIGTDSELEDAHAQATGFDPRTLTVEYVYLRITLHTIQAYVSDKTVFATSPAVNG